MAEIDKVIHVLKTAKNPAKRREAADILLNLGEQNPSLYVKILPTFIEALNDRDEGVVRRAAYAIYKASLIDANHVAEYVGYLVKFFVSGISHYPNPNLTSYGAYASIANTFGVIGERNPGAVAAAIKPMTACLNYPLYHPENPHSDLNKLYGSVLRTLGRIGHVNPALVKDSIQSIIKTLTDSFKYKSFLHENPRDKASVRWSATFAVEAIGASAPQLIVPHLVKCLTDSKKAIRDYGLSALNKMAHDPTRVIPPLIQCLGDEKPSIREEATNFLVKIGQSSPKYVVPSLMACFRSKNPLVKQHAAFALGEIGKKRPNDIKSAVPVLLNALKDKNKEVRQQSVDALFKIAEVNLGLVVQGTKYFIEALRDSYHHVRWRAVMIIGMIGEKSPLAVKDAVPILADMYNDPQDHVRWRAEETLKKMRVDKGKYLMAAKGIDLAKKLISEARESGVDTTRAEEALNMALVALNEMKYDRAIEMADRAKEATLSSGHEATSTQKTAPPAPQIATGAQTHPHLHSPKPQPQLGPQPQPPQPQAKTPQSPPVLEVTKPTGGISIPTEEKVASIPMSGPQPPPKEEGKIFCPYCGAENFEEFNFCIKCRRRLPKPGAVQTAVHSQVEVAGTENGNSDKETKYNIYRSALEEAWKDGAIKAEEMAMLDRLRDTLGLTLDEHQSLELEVRKKLGLI